jgi:hypothetical protein
MRRKHQTQQAALGVRTKSETVDKPEISMRQQLIRRFHEVLKEQQDHAIGTGCERAARWRAPAPGGREGQIDGLSAPALPSGNSANAAVAASAIAKKVCRGCLFVISVS